MSLQAVEQLQDGAIEQHQLTRLDSNCVRDMTSSTTNKNSSHCKSNKGSSNKNSSSCDGVYEDACGSLISVDITARVAAINLTAYSNNKAMGSAQIDNTGAQQQQQQQQQLQRQQREHRKQYKPHQPGQLPPQQHWQEQRQQQQQLPHVQVTFDAADAESGMQLVSRVLWCGVVPPACSMNCTHALSLRFTSSYKQGVLRKCAWTCGTSDCRSRWPRPVVTSFSFGIIHN
jgi:hypothetical protein